MIGRGRWKGENVWRKKEQIVKKRTRNNRKRNGKHLRNVTESLQSGFLFSER